jgi:single-stranded-DNA-specific exonuclease
VNEDRRFIEEKVFSSSERGLIRTLQGVFSEKQNKIQRIAMRGLRNTWKWRSPVNKENSDSLAQSLGCSRLIADLLVQRGINTFEEARTFFRPNLNNLHDPFLMAGMREAVARLKKAKENKERILVYGDYDVDGSSAVTMMSLFMEEQGFDCLWYQPDRYGEGYGVSLKGVEFAKSNGCGLIITLDCGIKAFEAIAHASYLSLDVVICDHHLPDEELPGAIAVLDPRRNDCTYPCKDLTGCGVGFKLAQAWLLATNQPLEIAWKYLDLIAISIAADIVAVTGENRIFCAEGLKRINTSPRQGIQALLSSAGVKHGELDIESLVFVLAPRINAAGRMAHASEAVHLLRSSSETEATELAAQLEEHNKTRKKEDAGITEEALAQIEADPQLLESSVTVVHGANWHKGVIGIVASRLIERYYRPTIVLAGAGEEITGSGRSIVGFDLHKSLQECADVLVKFGGHTMAAGLSIKVSDLEQFRMRFGEIAAACFSGERPVPELLVDCELDLEAFTSKDYAQIKAFGPFGPGNMAPVFVAKGLRDAGSRIVGRDGKHLKIQLQTASGLVVYGMAFSQAEAYDELCKGDPVMVAFSLTENVWLGKRNLQLMVKDFGFHSDII